jgi:hypothetical protein
MIVELTQQIQCAYTLEELKLAPKNQKGGFRGHGYYNHPCTKWVRESQENFDWAQTHAIALFHEKAYRFGGDHFCKTFLLWTIDNPPTIKNKLMTPFAQAMPDKYKNKNATQAYQDYYNGEKVYDNSGKFMFNWTRREKPKWAKVF